LNKRIFIAVNLPNELKKEIFETISSKLPNADCKIVAEKNLHITLKFLGYLPEEKINKIKEKMKAFQGFERFKIKLEKIGSFGNKVLWIGLSEGTEQLNLISDKLNKLLELTDDRFHAHITIARNKSLKANEVIELIENLNSEKLEKEFTAKNMGLMESVLSSTGPTYSILFKSEFK